MEGKERYIFTGGHHHGDEPPTPHTRYTSSIPGHERKREALLEGLRVSLYHYYYYCCCCCYYYYYYYYCYYYY